MSNFEYVLFSAIIHYSYPEAEDWTDVDTDVIVKTFEAIRYIAQVLNMHFPIFKRNRKLKCHSSINYYDKSQFDRFTNYILSNQIILLNAQEYNNYSSFARMVDLTESIATTVTLQYSPGSGW